MSTRASGGLRTYLADSRPATMRARRDIVMIDVEEDVKVESANRASVLPALILTLSQSLGCCTYTTILTPEYDRLKSIRLIDGLAGFSTGHSIKEKEES